jgi:hypothetical protein
MDALRWGTAHLSDEEFLREFESCRLPGENFHHADHLRVSWIYLRRFDEPAAQERMAQAIQRFSTHQGSPGKFHVTMTQAWMRLVAAAWRATPAITRFEEFAAAHPRLLDPQALAKHYSADLLGSASARIAWVEPDLAPLP